MERESKWVMEDIFEAVELNQYGYYQLRNMNSTKEREDIFGNTYFQDYNGFTYSKEYSQDELDYLTRKFEEKEYVIRECLKKTGAWKDGHYSLLDIGCGEGFLMKYFRQKGVKVKGFDLGSYALRQQNPDMEDVFEQGNMDDILPKLAAQGETFDVINMSRVLDMCLDAEGTLQRIRKLMTGQSILVIKTSHNYSHLQQRLLKSGELKQEYWLDAPDHTNYFNKEGMINLLDAQGYECMDFFADYFIDLNLLNPLTNYYEKPEVGKECYKATVRLANLMHDLSLEKTITIYRCLADLGFGREITGVFRLKQ